MTQVLGTALSSGMDAAISGMAGIGHILLGVSLVLLLLQIRRSISNACLLYTSVLTESMFYVLMSFLHREMCGIEITEFVEQKTNGRVRLGPGTLYTLLGKFQDEHLIEETQTDGRKRSYRLTERGRAVFKDELARLKACVLDGEEEFL